MNAIPRRPINYTPYYSEIRKKQVYVVLTDYEYYDHLDRLRKIPAGFIFDGVSRPWFLEWYLPMNSINNIAFGRHDEGYCHQQPFNIKYPETQSELRKQADKQLFLDICRNKNNSILKGLLVYLNIRLFGWWAWRQNKKYMLLYGKEYFIISKQKLNKILTNLNDTQIQYN